MGVEFLKSTCLNNTDRCTKTVNLVEIARQQNGIELIVDFYSFLYTMLLEFTDILCRRRKNSFLKISGGEYASVKSFLTKFVDDLKYHNIHLVFYKAGAKGSSAKLLYLKWKTWVFRHQQDIDRASQVVDVLNKIKRIDRLEPETYIHPVLIEEVFVETLKSCGCEVQSAAGEANTLIINALRERPKAFAIWSSNAEYCVIDRTELILFELFDLEGDLMFGEPRPEHSRPCKLMVKVVTNAKVMSMLKITNNDMFINLAIVAGNDYTRHFMREGGILKRLNVPHQRKYPSLAEYVEWMKPMSNARHLIRVLETEMDADPKFRDAVTYSRQLYSVQCTDDESPKKCNFSPVIEENVRSCQFASEIMSIHHNYYCHRKLVEENTASVPCAEWALQKLRKYIYRIVLAPDDKCVTEGGRIKNNTIIRHEKIYAVEYTEVPSLEDITPGDNNTNSETFCKIMSHLEIGNSSNWFDKYDMKEGFVVFVLRYFLKLSSIHNLGTTDNEAVALAAMSLSCHKVKYFQRIEICPPA